MLSYHRVVFVSYFVSTNPISACSSSTLRSTSWGKGLVRGMLVWYISIWLVLIPIGGHRGPDEDEVDG